MDHHQQHLPRPRVLPTLTSVQPKDVSSCLWPRIAFGIWLITSIALKCVVVILIFSGSQVPSEGVKARRWIQSCLQKCIPCGAAKNHITANLTLDPSTAHPQLYVSPDLKSVRWRDMKQQVNGSPLRYDVLASVLSHESFTSGKLCWEVEVVAGGDWWGVGIVRESSNRNGPIIFDPSGGYWGVQRINGQYESITHPRTNLSLCLPPKRIRVSLDYSQGLVAFFDGDTNAELFTFPKADFAGEKMHAWFLIYKWNGQLLLHP